MRAEIRAAHGPFIDDTLAHVQTVLAEAPAVFQPILGYHFRRLEQTKGFRIALVQALHVAGVRAGLDSLRAISAEALVQRAACLHLLHEASLMIDDIFDHATVRRGQRAAHCRFGRVPTASAAAWLCTWVAGQFTSEPDMAQAVLRMGEEIAIAETLQWQARLLARPLRFQVWQEIALGDTGALFRLAARFAGLQPGVWGHVVDALTYLYHGLDDIQDIQATEADDGFAGGGDADVRDHIPTLMTCFTEGKEAADLLAAVPEAKRALLQFGRINRPTELDVFFAVLPVK